ncbi:MAG: DUF4012 domain-containing protein [Microgenomates group bacterium]
MITAQINKTQKPQVLIVSQDDFLSLFLSKALFAQGCRVIILAPSSKKEIIEKKLLGNDFLCLSFNFDSSVIFFPAEIIAEKIDYILDLGKSSELTKSLLGLAEKNKAKILILNSELSLEEIKKNFSQVNFRILEIPFVYGPGMDEKDFWLLKQKNFSLPALFITDAVLGILKAIFLPHTSGKKFSLSSTGEKDLNWQPITPLEEGIKETEEFFLSKKQKPFFQKKTSGEKPSFVTLKEILSVSHKELPVKEKKFKSGIFFLLLLFFFFLFYGLGFFLGINFLKKGINNAIEGDFSSAKKSFLLGKKFFNLFPSFDGISDLKKLNSLLIKTTEVTQKGEEIFNFVLGKERETNLLSLTEEIKADLDELYFYFSILEKEVEIKKEKNWLTKQIWLRGNFGELKERNKELKNVLIKTKGFLNIFPSLLGEKEKRTYLVLLQNSAELRPTGGFIGSIAFLTFNKGRLIDFEVQDVYWADGQLKGHVEPPEEIKKYLGEANWYLRDVNWDPDFPTVAQKAQWFLDKETGRTVDGVIGINIYFIQDLLKAIGEIEIPDYEEKINADNFFERAEYYSEVGFFPGSTQKQDFLGKVARVLFSEIKKAENKKKLEIAYALYRSLEEKNILLYFNNSQEQKEIFNLGWDGGLKNINCQKLSKEQEEECFGDYLMIVEANLGVNKVNYFVERNVDHFAEIDSEGRIKKSLIISYVNKSTSEKFPGGKYKNYLRIIVPKKSELMELKIGGKAVEKDKIKIEEEKEKTIFGFLVEVPPADSLEVEVYYFLPWTVSSFFKNNWFFLVQKQSGIKPEKFSFKIKASRDWVIIPQKPIAVYDKDFYSFKLDFNKDLFFEIKLIKN